MTFRGTLARLDCWMRLRHGSQRRSMLRLSRRFVDDVLGRYGRRLGAWRGVLVHVLLGGVGSARMGERPHGGRPAAAPEVRTIHRLITLHHWTRTTSPVERADLPPLLRGNHGNEPAPHAVPSAEVHQRVMPAQDDRTIGPALAQRSIGRLVSSVETGSSLPVLVFPRTGRVAGAGIVPITSRAIGAAWNRTRTIDAASIGAFGAQSRAGAHALATSESPRTASAPMTMRAPFPSRDEPLVTARRPFGASFGTEPRARAHALAASASPRTGSASTVMLAPFPSRAEPLATARPVPATVPRASAGLSVAHARPVFAPRSRWSADAGGGDVVRPTRDGAPKSERPRPMDGEGERLVAPTLPNAMGTPRQAQGSPSDVERSSPANERRYEDGDRLPLAHPSRLGSIPVRQTATLAPAPTRLHRAPDAAADAPAPLRREPATRVHPEAASAAPRTTRPEMGSPALATTAATMRMHTGRSWQPSPSIPLLRHTDAFAPRVRRASASTIGAPGVAVPGDVMVPMASPLTAWTPAARWRPAAADDHAASPSIGVTSPPASVVGGVVSEPVAAPGLPKPMPALRLARTDVSMGGEPAPGRGLAGVPEAPAAAPSLTLAPPPGGLRSEPGSFDKRTASPTGSVVAQGDAVAESPRAAVPGPGDVRRLADAVYTMIVDRVRRERVARGW